MKLRSTTKTPKQTSLLMKNNAKNRPHCPSANVLCLEYNMFNIHIHIHSLLYAFSSTESTFASFFKKRKYKGLFSEL